MPYVNKKRLFATSAIALTLALIFFNFIGWLNPIKNLAAGANLSIAGKIRNAWLNLSADYNFWKQRDDYIANQNQMDEVKQNLDQATAQLELIGAENEKLKQLLNFKENNKATIFATKIISMETGNAEKTLVLDGGRNNGIKVGQAVVIGKGILIGKIIRVEPTMSFVRLLVDSQSKVAAAILNQTQSIGVAEGGYGISIKINFIPRNENVIVGDMVVTSGLEADFPRGLFIGKVVAIENESYQPFQQAIVLPEADLSKINIVGVILTK